MKKTYKTVIFATLLLLTNFLTSCIMVYDPIKLKIDNEKAIAKKVKNIYKNYGKIEILSYEKKTVSEMGYEERVSSEYHNNIAYCRVDFKLDNDPYITFSATNRIVFRTYVEFGMGWEEPYTSDFYSYYYEKQLYEYYNNLLQQNFSEYNYKLIREDINSYNISTFPETYKSFDDFLKNKDSLEAYLVLLPQNVDNRAEILISSFEYRLQNEKTNVVYRFVFLPDTDFSKINSLDDIDSYTTDIYKYIVYSKGNYND